MTSKKGLTEEQRVEIVDCLFQKGEDVIRTALGISQGIIADHNEKKLLMAAGEFSLAAHTPIEVLEASFTQVVAQELLTHEANGTDFDPYAFARKSGNHIS